MRRNKITLLIIFQFAIICSNVFGGTIDELIAPNAFKANAEHKPNQDHYYYVHYCLCLSSPI